VEADEGRVDLARHSGRRPGVSVALREASLSSDGQPTTSFRLGGPLRLDVSYDWGATRPTSTMFAAIVEDSLGQRIVAYTTIHQAPEIVHATSPRGTITLDVPEVRLLPGLYHLTFILADGSELSPTRSDHVERAVRISVEPSDVFGNGFTPQQGRHGFFYQEARWSHDPS